MIDKTEFHALIVNEFKNVKKQCEIAENIDDKLYFFSATYGVLNRVMNFECKPIYVFMHQILVGVHQALTQRLASARKSPTMSQHLPPVFTDKAFELFSDLIDQFESQEYEKVKDTLEKFSNLTYAMSGNGFYLYLQKKLIV